MAGWQEYARVAKLKCILVSKVTPTQRTLAHLRKAGYDCAIVERWNAHLKIRQDLFNFLDVLGVSGMGTIAVQTTTKSNFAARWNKITGRDKFTDLKAENKALKIREHVLNCLAAGWIIEVHGWAGSNDVRIQEVTNESLVSLISDEQQEGMTF